MKLYRIKATSYGDLNITLYSAFRKSLCTYKRCWKWCPRAPIQAWTRLILFANSFCRSAFGKSLCTYKRCWKWCPRASIQAWTKSTYCSLSAQRLSERTVYEGTAVVTWNAKLLWILARPNESTFLMLLDLRKSCLLEGSQALSPCRSGKSDVYMKMSMGHGGMMLTRETEVGLLGEILFQCYFAHEPETYVLNESVRTAQ
jgi:hypothetical protein